MDVGSSALERAIAREEALLKDVEAYEEALRTSEAKRAEAEVERDAAQQRVGEL